MDHLLDTLRGEHICSEYTCNFDDVMNEAADEIEQLRAALMRFAELSVRHDNVVTPGMVRAARDALGIPRVIQQLSGNSTK